MQTLQSVGSHFSSRRRKGQAIVESALVMSLVVLPALLGFLQYGVILYTAHNLQSLAREGARFAAVHGGESTFDNNVNQANPPSLLNYLRTVCSTTNVNYNDLTGNIPGVSPARARIFVTPSASRTSGQGITVQITYPMSRKFFVGSMEPGVPAQYTATATFVLE